tara:strand:+ start:424 stop:768 length:345 start_codon:yes stop_codon:yes gene_type:complete
MNNDFNNMIEIFQNKLNKLVLKSNKIKDNFNQDKFNINENNLRLFLDVSKNINLINDQLDDLYILSLKTNQNNLNSEEKLIIRNNKINNIVNKKFLPYMLFLQICLQNIDLENY